MATYMEKDVLLEIASVGYLIKDTDMTDEAEADIAKMGKLRWEILTTDPEQIDFDDMVKKIKSIKEKYERNRQNGAR